MEPATYNINFVQISVAHNKAGDCLSWLVDVKDMPATPTALIKMLVTSTPDGIATCTHSKTPNTANTTSTNDKVNAPPTVIADHKDTLRLIQQTDPFSKYISKRHSVAMHPQMR